MSLELSTPLVTVRVGGEDACGVCVDAGDVLEMEALRRLTNLSIGSVYVCVCMYAYVSLFVYVCMCEYIYLCV